MSLFERPIWYVDEWCAGLPVKSSTRKDWFARQQRAQRQDCFLYWDSVQDARAYRSELLHDKMGRLEAGIAEIKQHLEDPQ